MIPCQAPLYFPFCFPLFIFLPSLFLLQKFLVNRDGEAVHRYDMTFDSAQLQADIEALLAEQPTNL